MQNKQFLEGTKGKTKQESKEARLKLIIKSNKVVQQNTGFQ